MSEEEIRDQVNRMVSTILYALAERIEGRTVGEKSVYDVTKGMREIARRLSGFGAEVF